MQITLQNLLVVLCILVAVNADSIRSKRSSKVCGNPKRPTGFIFGGNRSTRGEFPWVVALMMAPHSGPPTLVGGGTLISDRHVVTAAHCIRPKDGLIQLYPSNVIVQFGVYNLSNPHELGKHSLSPEEIIVHQDWNPFVARYDADIAILIFEEGDIPLTRYVQPVCLWTTSNVPPKLEGNVAGWGKSEDNSKPYEETPKKIKLVIRTNEDCLLKSPELVKLFSKRTFCAGLDDGSGVCLGDSGNGLIVQHNGHSYLRGIVSSSLLSGSVCDVRNYAIYTDVLKFIPWIMQIVSDGGNLVIPEAAVEPDPVYTQPTAEQFRRPITRPEKVSTRKPEVVVVYKPEADKEDGEDTGFPAGVHEIAYNELDCSQVMMDFDFEYLGKKRLRTCLIRNQPVNSERTIVKRNADYSKIQGLNIDNNKDVKFLPEKLGKNYPELMALRVSHCGVKSMEGKHFKGLKKLMFMSMFGNNIDKISSDAFKDLSSLQFLHLSNNDNMKKVDPMAFKDLPSLKYIWIDQLSLTEVPENLFKYNPHMTRICLKNNKLRYVSPQTFEGLDNLRTVILTNSACASKTYWAESFNTMRQDLLANCNRKQ